MKTINLLFVICLFTLFSCNSEENACETSLSQEPSEMALSPEFANVQREMLVLNSDVAIANPSQTRGLFGWFRRILGVTVADAVGGIVCSWFGPAGAAAGATATSGLVAAFLGEPEITISTRSGGDDELFLPMNPEDKSLDNLVPEVVGEELLSVDDSIGYFHNRILLDIKNENAGVKLSREDLLTCIAQKTSTFYGVDEKDIKRDMDANKDVFDFVTQSEYKSLDNESIHDIVAAWIARYPSKREELTLLETFFSGLSNIDVDENDGNYLMKVLELVDQSELSEETKKNLHNAFIVGNASYQLWNVSGNRN